MTRLCIMATSTKYPWNKTPLIRSQHISKLLGVNAYLKLENLNPSHSFKHRGLSLFALRTKEQHGPGVHLVVASGGNAGYATACAAYQFCVRCTVYIPEGVSEITLKLLKAQNAEVVVIGKFFLEALEAAKKAVETQEHTVLVPAYDHPTLWEGHGTMIEEIHEQLTTSDQPKPDAILCSVGGGGLLGGVITGCKKVGWDDVPLIGIETIGSNCFHHTVLLNSPSCSEFATTLPPYVKKVHDETSNLTLAHFTSFPSKASGSLGASQPAVEVVKMALERAGSIQCVSVPDEISMQTSIAFADDHKMLVELACATALATAYKPQLLNALVPPKPDGSKRTVVWVVCGGIKVNMSDMVEYQRLLDAQIEQNPLGQWEVVCNDGKVVKVDYTS